MTVIPEENSRTASRAAKSWNPFRIHRHAGPSPYIWHGMRVGAWFRLLAEGGFDVTLNCLPRILGVTAVTPFNSGFHYLSEWVYGRKVSATAVAPPIFVIGHWRTGTTFMHELLASDPANGYPTTYQCMFPNSFLVTEWIAARLFGGLLPGKRPSDNVRLAFDTPQEEEFALANLGIGTPYLSLAFPRQGARGMRYLDLADLDDGERADWERAFLTLARKLQFAHGKRLVFKSPLHTARIPTLLRLFPDARFVHMARHPFSVFPSTLHTWKSMGSVQGLHNPMPADDGWLRDHVFDVFERLFDCYERDRHAIPPGHLTEVRYEDLVADPKGTVAAVYRSLGLDGFEAAAPHIDACLAERRDYKRNSLSLSDGDRRSILRRWRPYFERFGYAAEPAPSGAG